MNKNQAIRHAEDQVTPLVKLDDGTYTFSTLDDGVWTATAPAPYQDAIQNRRCELIARACKALGRPVPEDALTRTTTGMNWRNYLPLMNPSTVSP